MITDHNNDEDKLDSQKSMDEPDVSLIVLPVRPETDSSTTLPPQDLEQSKDKPDMLLTALPVRLGTDSSTTLPPQDLEQSKDEPDMLLTALPVRPGTDLSSKLLLQDSKMKDIVITTVMGKGISGDAYYVGPCDRYEGRRTDVVYFPDSKTIKDFPPVIVEIQQKVNHSFVTRAMRYCLDILDETKKLPILVIFNVEGCSGKEFFEKTYKKGDGPYYTQYCHPWAKSVYLFNLDSIAKHVQETPMQPIVALTYFFTQKQRHLLALDDFEDPTLHLIYRSAYKSFSKTMDFAFDQSLVWNDFCDTIALQFSKIVKAVNENTTNSKKRMVKYADDGINFSKKMKHFCQNSEGPNSGDVTPIEASSSAAKSEDFVFVERYRNRNSGKMNWEDCFEEGKQENTKLFSRYKSHLTLKRAFHDNTL